MIINDLNYFYPEIISIILLLFILLESTYTRNNNKSVNFETKIKNFSYFYKITLIFLFLIAISTFMSTFVFINTNSVYQIRYTNNIFTSFIKFCAVIFTFIVILCSKNYFITKYKINSAEFFFYIWSALLSIFVIISSTDLINFYIAAEYQSLIFYSLVSFKKYSRYSIEASIKYFIFGSVASIFMLFGIFIIYISVGTFNLYEIKYITINTNIEFFNSYIFYIGIVFILVGIAFKLSIAPFHYWTPDVYEGSSAIVTFFFAIVSKISIFSFVTTLCYIFFEKFYEIWSIFFFLFGLYSLFIGTIGALHQKKIKRFLGYTTISHIGLIIISFSIGTWTSLYASIFYLITYCILNTIFFIILLGIKKNIYGYNVEYISDFINLSISYPIIIIIFSFILFSIAGIPPFMGFFSKFFVIYAIIEQQYYFVALMILIITSISCFYYIRIIAYIFFIGDKKYVKFVNFPFYYYIIILLISIFNIQPVYTLGMLKIIIWNNIINIII